MLCMSRVSSFEGYFERTTHLYLKFFLISGWSGGHVVVCANGRFKLLLERRKGFISEINDFEFWVNLHGIAACCNR